MTLEVIGAGFGRTGTLTLKIALEKLGLGPCCHGLEERHFMQQTDFWERVFNHDPIDWDQFFHGFRATVDSPSCRFYQELAEYYPGSKVILTRREPDAWFASYEATVLPMVLSSRGGRLYSFLFGDGPPDRTRMIEAYERHNAQVQKSISPERLLVYDVSSGWDPLCDFLGVPVPDRPFPHSNLRADFPTMIDGMLAVMERRRGF